MSDYETRLDDAIRGRLDDAMEREHTLLNAHDDPTDFEHCYICTRLLAYRDEHARGQHTKPVDGCVACEEFDEDADVDLTDCEGDR